MAVHLRSDRKRMTDLKRIVRKRMLAILITIRYILIQYSGAWVINERILY